MYWSGDEKMNESIEWPVSHSSEGVSATSMIANRLEWYSPSEMGGSSLKAIKCSRRLLESRVFLTRFLVGLQKFSVLLFTSLRALPLHHGLNWKLKNRNCAEPWKLTHCKKNFCSQYWTIRCENGLYYTVCYLLQYCLLKKAFWNIFPSLYTSHIFAGSIF